MKQSFVLAVSVAFSLALGACATSFQGSAHVGGAAACEQKCGGQGMELAGIVYMGDYSSACVCEVPGRHVGTAPVAAATGGAVGVVMQQRRQQDRNN